MTLADFILFFKLICVGLLVGPLSSFFGIGGSIITIPSLYFLFPHISPITVIGSSLGIIALNSLFNTFSFFRLGKRPHIPTILLLGLSMVLGSIAGSQMILILPPATVKLVFASALLLISLRNIFFSAKKFSPTSTSSHFPQLFSWKILLIGLSGGWVSGITGLGGGLILIPLLHQVLKIPFAWIPIYTNASMFFGAMTSVIKFSFFVSTSETSLPANFLLFQKGHLNLLLVLVIFLGSFMTAPFGVRYSQKVSPALSQKLFNVLLLLLSLQIFLSTLKI